MRCTETVNDDHGDLQRSAFPDARLIETLYWPASPPFRYALAYGNIPSGTEPPRWGLTVLDGVAFPTHIWERPRVVTEGALREWLDTLTDTSAAYDLASRMATSHPEWFADN